MVLMMKIIMIIIMMMMMIIVGDMAGAGDTVTAVTAVTNVVSKNEFPTIFIASPSPRAVVNTGTGSYSKSSDPISIIIKILNNPYYLLYPIKIPLFLSIVPVLIFHLCDYDIFCTVSYSYTFHSYLFIKKKLSLCQFIKGDTCEVK